MELKRRKRYICINVVILLILVFVISVTVILFSSFNKTSPSYEYGCEFKGKSITQTVYNDKGDVIALDVASEIEDFDLTIINKINQERNKSWVEVDDETLELLSICKDIQLRSNNALDVCTLNLDKLKINYEIKRVKIIDDQTQISVDPLIEGISCEVAKKVYRQYGVTAAIISMGHTVGVYGEKTGGKSWNIALRDGMNPEDILLSMGVLKIDNGVVSSVFSKEEPELKSHTDVLCVSVHHENATIANILAKACYVLGVEESRYLLNHFGGSAIFADKEKNVYLSENIKDSFVLTDKTYSLK